MPLWLVIENGYVRNEYTNHRDGMDRLIELQKRYREEIERDERIDMPSLGLYQLMGVAI